jgi:hypothetical protein
VTYAARRFWNPYRYERICRHNARPKTRFIKSIHILSLGSLRPPCAAMTRPSSQFPRAVARCVQRRRLTLGVRLKTKDFHWDTVEQKIWGSLLRVWQRLMRPELYILRLFTCLCYITRLSPREAARIRTPTYSQSSSFSSRTSPSQKAYSAPSVMTDVIAESTREAVLATIVAVGTEAPVGLGAVTVTYVVPGVGHASASVCGTASSCGSTGSDAYPRLFISGLQSPSHGSKPKSSSSSSSVARREELPVSTTISRGSSKLRFVRPVGVLPFVIPGSGATAYRALNDLLLVFPARWYHGSVQSTAKH